MKRKLWLPVLILSMMLALAGCKKEEDVANQPMLEVIEYTNIIDSSATTQLETLMKDAGISMERQQILLEHISQMNSSVDTEGLASIFESAHISKMTYNPDIMLAEWMNRNPTFPGYNDRITTFSLFGDYLDIAADSTVRDVNLEMDILALQTDTSALVGTDNLQKFKALYSTIPTEKAEGVNGYAAAVQKDWKERGISIKDDEKIRMITLFCYDAQTSELYAGHVGLIFPVEEDKEEVIYFLEKINFQEPYQLTRFANRTELSDYLMYKYGSSKDGDAAVSFIMENNQLMEGYRQLPETTEE
ncbi:MAG: DUF4300 family protein [Lachnospiraceae bacterium]|nr:DUF4300 family protein [Lachnospiraceae bacterium]